MDDYVGLIFGCPSQGNHYNCPFSIFWEMDKEDAFDAWSSLNSLQKQNMVNLHKACPYSCKRNTHLAKMGAAQSIRYLA